MAIFNFQKPDKVIMIDSNDFEGKFEFRPLEPGYGLTVGNALRRVLLSALEGYAITSIDNHIYKCHRLAWFYMTGAWPVGQIDHKNGARADNRFDNLRDVAKQQNTENQRKAQRSNKSTEMLGTFRNGSGFAARISHQNAKIYLGTFSTIEEASAAYVTAKRLLHKGCTI